ncbi:MAG: 50S ribosomal protein L32 [Brumimicrobium sp.]
MAVPKRRASSTRRAKRRTHKKANVMNNIATCPTTGQSHLYHRAHWHEGKLYYKGKVIAEKEVAV